MGSEKEERREKKTLTPALSHKWEREEGEKERPTAWPSSARGEGGKGRRKTLTPALSHEWEREEDMGVL